MMTQKALVWKTRWQDSELQSLRDSKRKAKPTAPDEAGKTTIRKSKNIPKGMGSRVKEESNIEIERQKRPYY